MWDYGTEKVKGLRELDEFLRDFPTKVQGAAMLAALRKTGKLYADNLYSAVPVQHGPLRDSIRIRKRTSGGVAHIEVVVGGKTRILKPVFYAHMVEYGTKPHEITAKPGQVLHLRDGRMVHSVMHPGAHARPFMRPVWDTMTGEAIEAFRDALADEVQKLILTRYIKK